MKLIIYTMCFLCLSGCTNKSNYNYDKLIDKFPLVDTLRATEIKIPSILLSPSNMCIVDSFMIVSQHRPDSIFSIFGLPDCEYRLSFGNAGKGPNEFYLSFEYVTLASVYKNKSSFAVGNMLTKIRYYKINDIINGVYEPYRVENLPQKLNRFRSILYISDSLIFGAPYGGNMHLFKFSTNTKALELFSKYPDKYPLLDQEIKRDVYGCSIAVKPDNSKFAVAYSTMGKIEIYDLTKGDYKSILYKGFPSLEENTGLNSTSKFWYHNPEEFLSCRNIATTDKFIYVDVFNDQYSKIFDVDGPRKTFIPEIHVFDWSGNPIAKFRLAAYYRYFDIDKMDRFLYTIDDNIENVINRYDLTKSLPINMANSNPR